MVGARSIRTAGYDDIEAKPAAHLDQTRRNRSCDCCFGLPDHGFIGELGKDLIGRQRSLP